jgi:hypothetical protein
LRVGFIVFCSKPRISAISFSCFRVIAILLH